MECIGVGSITTTTQIILYINWYTTLLILVIQSVRASSEVTLEPWRYCLLLAVSVGQSHFTAYSQSVSQYVLVSSPLCGRLTRYCFLFKCLGLKFVVFSLWDALSDERPGLSFVNHSLVICLCTFSQLQFFRGRFQHHPPRVVSSKKKTKDEAALRESCVWRESIIKQVRNQCCRRYANWTGLLRKWNAESFVAEANENQLTGCEALRLQDKARGFA
jgi:hypothetical protein